MVDVQLALMAGLTVLGFVNAVPPRHILDCLKSLRSKARRSDPPIFGDAVDRLGKNGGQRR